MLKEFKGGKSGGQRIYFHNPLIINKIGID
jgi:hypothetical protein